ncbi:MAG: hypothetical protein ACTSQE_04460 [Candidatus Heimdallarchaeaceae archaeon]
MSSDKIIGSIMMVFSLAVMVATVLFTLVLPIIDENYAEIGYFVMAGIISLAVIIVMLLLAWIGWTLFKTKAPEIELDDLEEADESETDTTEKKEEEK